MTGYVGWLFSWWVGGFIVFGERLRLIGGILVSNTYQRDLLFVIISAESLPHFDYYMCYTMLSEGSIVRKPKDLTCQLGFDYYFVVVQCMARVK